MTDTRGSHTDTPVDADAFWAEWERRLGPGGLLSYRYLGCHSEASGRHEATGALTLRHDLRWQGGLQAAPLGISLLDTAGINVDAIATAAPTQIDLTILDDAADVRAVRIHGHIVREGRTQMFTEGRFEDVDRPGRVVALGSTSWAVVRLVPPGYRYVDPGPGVEATSDLPPLVVAFGGYAHRGGGFELPGLTIHTSEHSLHQGHVQVLLEAAAQEAAAPAGARDGELRLRHAGTTIVARGTTGPFVSSASVVSATMDAVAVRSELRDQGADDRLVATGLHVYVPSR